MNLINSVMFLALFNSALSAQEKSGQKQKEQPKILFIIASDNFRDEEYEIPKRILTFAGYKVITASSKLKDAKGMLGMTVKPDILISKIDVKDYVSVVFIGGSGASEYWTSPIAHKIAKDTLLQEKVLGAICIAPVTLANADVLKGKKATVFPSEKNKLKLKGATVTDSLVEIDGNIITGRGPESASGFAEAVKTAIRQLEIKNKNKEQEIKNKGSK